MKKIKNLTLSNIGFPCACCLFPKSKTKRKLLFNNFKLQKSILRKNGMIGKTSRLEEYGVN